ncbi:hypothetical protein HQ520_18995 [bacterium]|nr:hypothetical protein [bacterium]
MAYPVGVALLAGSIWIAFRTLFGGRRDWLWVALFAGMMGGAWMSRLHSGGYNNVLIPAYAVLSLLFGLALHEVLSISKDRPKAEGDFLRLAVFGICLFQFVLLVYNPLEALPTAADRAAGEAFLDELARLEGEVLIFHPAFLPTRVGKNSYGQTMAVNDVLRGGGEEAAALAEKIARALETRRFSAIINGGWMHSYPRLKEAFMQNYVLERQLFEEPCVFVPVTGNPSRPEYVFRPRDASSGKR